MTRVLLILLGFLLLAWTAPARAQSDPLAGLGDLGLIISGQRAEVEPRLREALAAAERSGDLHGQAASHLFLGMATFGQQKLSASREHLRRSANLFESQKDHLGAWIALWALGELEENEGQLDTALAHHDRSLAFLGEAGSSTAPFTIGSFRSFAAFLGVPAEAFDSLKLAPEILGPMILPLIEAITIDSRAGTLIELGRLEEAEAELSRVAEIAGLFTEMLDSSVAGHTGDLRRRQGRLEEARASYHKALGGVGTLPSFQRDRTEMSILDRLADIELITGHLDEALALNDRSLGLARSNHNVKREASILQDRANLLLRGQRFEAAAEVFGRALALARSNSNVYREATILSDLGFLEFTAGRYQKAVERLEGSVRLFRGLDEPYVEAPVWLILSESYLILGAHESARSALDKAHELAQKSGFRAAGAMADLVGAMERHHSGQGTRDAMDQSFKAFLQVPETRGLVFNEEAALLHESFRLGEPRTGGPAPTPPDPEALARSGQPYLPDAARFLLGKLRLDGGDLEGARAIWLQALEANEHLNRDLKAGLLGAVGATYIREGKTEEAIPYFSRAVETVDRSDVKVEELMAGYLGGERHLYSEILIETLLRQGRPQEAFEAAERARARTFLQQIGNRRLRPTDGGDPRLAQDAEDLRVLIPTLERKALFALPEEKEHREAGVALALARQHYQALLVRLKVSNSEYSAITRVETIQVRDLQKEIPPDATLISYFLSSRGVQAWVIDRETFQYVALPLQGDDTGRAVCWADQIGRRGQEDSSSRGVIVPGPHCKAGAATSEEVYEKLIAPLRPYIRHPRLLIVPHGTLHYLPFAAMRDPQSGCYLTEQHTLTYLPSASALRFLRDKETPVEGGALVLGDPASSRPDLRSLPAAEKEADLVAKAFATSPVLGTRATESTLYRLNGSVDLLHIAAHGIYEPANPLFSRIALAPGEEHDGNLEVHEILGTVDLTGVNLVVLSACRTASGRRSGGDEIVGLTRAFLYAGSPGVVSTLWEIDDTASAVLMEDFYRHLREGASAAEALRQAQLGLLASPLYSDPYYWAAFSLTGDPQGQWEDPHPRPLSRKRERGEQQDQPSEMSSLFTPLPLAGEGPGVRAPPSDPLAGMGELGLIISGKAAEVEPRLREALEAAELAGDQQGQAACHLFLGMATFRQQKVSASREHLRRSAELFEGQRDPFGAWTALWALGALEENEGQLDTALAYHDRSLTLLRDAGSSTAPFSVASFRSFAAALGVPAEAFDSLKLAPESLWPMMLPLVEAITIDSRAGTLIELGRLEEAEAELSRVEEISGLLPGLLDSSVSGHIGDLRRRQGRLEEARASYHKALGDLGAMPSFQRDNEEMSLLDRLSDIELMTGHLEEALGLNDKALALARRNGNVKREASILQDRANLLLRGQRFGDAAEVFARALALARDSNNVYRQALVLRDFGVLSVAAGRYQEAVEHLESSIHLFRDLEESLMEGPTWLFLSEAYFLLGAPDAARSALEKGRELARVSDFRLAGALADVIESAERLKSGQGSRDAAEQSFEAVLRIPDARWLLPDAEVLSSVRAMLQHGYPRDGDTAQPVSDPEALARSGLPFLPDAARLLLGSRRLDSGDLEGARAIWLQILETNEHLNRDLRAGLLTGISGIYLKEGKPDEAIRYLSSAVELVEGSDVTVEELMAGYLGGERHLYSELLVAMLIRQGRPQEAFEAAERARARAFLQQIGNRRLRPADAGDPRLAQEAESLRVQIPILERQALHPPPEEQARRSADLALARRRYQALLVRLKVSNSEYSTITRVDTLEVRDLQKEIPSDATLISYFLSPHGIQAWVIDRETFQYVALPVRGDDLWRALCWADQISRRGWKDSSSRGVTVPGLHCKAGAATSEEVYEKLIAPLRPHIRHQKLLIIPHHTLHYLPFAAMRDPQSGCYLTEQHTLTYLPSASALRFLRDKETPVEGGVLVLGDPASSRPDLRALPAAEKEADLVAEAFATSPVLGTRATESTLYRLNRKVDLLHIAAHGIYEPVNPLFSRIALAPGEEHDGNLEVHEILGAVDLTGVNLVVLSACRTASGRRSGGDEIVGLTRAFLYAGSPGVVSTLWEIDDTASAVLMEDFYRHLREGAPAAEALRQAQLGLLASPLYSDPYYWAAFSLTGDPQGQW